MPDENELLSLEYARLRAIVENAVDAIVTIDDRGRMESANPATTELFQYSTAELLGANVSLLMPSPFREEHDTYIRRYLQSGIPKIIGIGREVTGRRKDGSTFPTHLAVSEVTVNGRRVFTGVVRDISGLKQAQGELEQLNNELEQRVRRRTEQLRQAQAKLLVREKLATIGQVSAGIAHEIRNPLNAVKTSAYYLLRAKNATEEKKQEHLERIDRQVTIIDNVISALSDVARLPEPRVSALAPDTILNQVIREVSLPAEISVQLHVPRDVDWFLADEHQISIVFRNLLRNAREAMPRGGIITVAVERRDANIAIAVRDTGMGIAREDLSRILEPLYSTKARGMGLGLAICAAILEKNGGRLHIESELGKGSTFTVELLAGA